MFKYAISADSGCDLTVQVCEEKGIIPLKMVYTMGGVSYIDEMTAESIKAFYDRFREGQTAQTSQISLGEYDDFFRPFAQEGKDILHVSLGSAISGSYNNAVSAASAIKEEYPEWNYRIVDSTQASAGEGMVAVMATELREKGCTLDECADSLDGVKASISAIFTTDDLTSLCQGGRVSKVGAIVGTVLNIRPILHLDKPGNLKVIEKVRGDKTLRKRMIELVEENVIMPEGQTLYVSHADALDKAKEYVKLISEHCKFKDVFYTSIGSTIGAHTGPNLVAFFFVGKQRVD